MSADTRLSRRAALASILAGGSLIVLDTYSFTAVQGERSTTLDASDDASALLAIEGKSAGNTPTYTNNFATDLSVTLSAPNESSAEFDVGTDGSSSPTVTFTLPPGESVDVGMSGDVRQITVDVQGTFANGTVDLQRVFEISQAGQVDISATVKGIGNSGKFEFGLENTGSIDAVLDSIRVDQTSTTATQVGKGDIFSLTDGGDSSEQPRQLLSSTLNIGASQRTNFDGSPDTVTLPANDTSGDPGTELVFEFDRFRGPKNNGNGYQSVGMKNQSVTFTLGFEDGSTRQYTLQDS